MIKRLPVSVQLALLACLLMNAPIARGQNSFTDKVAGWKTAFPKADVVANVYRETINFSINAAMKPGESPVKATVSTDIMLVPLKDYIKYDDGLFYNDEMSIEDIKIMSPENKEVKFEKLCGDYSSEDIFHSDARVCVLKFPLAEKGKGFQYSYKEQYKDVKYLTSLYFVNNIPSVERIIQVNVPSWLEIDLREFNFAGNLIEKSVVKEGDITRTTFRLSNVAPYKKEPHSPNHAISNPHLICVTKAFTNAGQRTVLFENVKNVYAWYNSVCADIGNKPEEIKAKVADLIANKKTDQEKIESIFYWVQDNIRYIAFENGIMGFKPDAAQNVLKNKYGDCKGKANLLKTMLTIAGYDARLTWIGTSDLPYDYSLPSLVVDNHMICTLILNGKRYFLDGTEYYIALNDYAQRIQGKEVLIEDNKNYILDKIPEFPAERNKTSVVKKISITDNVLTGTSSAEYNGESKIGVQGAYASIRSDKKADALNNFLKNDNSNVEISNVSNANFTDRQKPLQFTYDFKANNQVTKTGNELYVVMDWNKDFGSLEMPDDRKNDYEFNQKYYVTEQTELTVPAGYKVDYVPAAFKKVTPSYSFEGSYINKGKSILYTKTIIINKPILKKSNFTEWNSFIADISKFYNDQVVLTK
ncbi:MAG: transglutaminase-like superfamily protein [Ferruginibacter sp.]|nr:transglutaminase-like superfamily protein [Ferruginibacter sp.]